LRSKRVRRQKAGTKELICQQSSLSEYDEVPCGLCVSVVYYVPKTLTTEALRTLDGPNEKAL